MKQMKLNIKQISRPLDLQMREALRTDHVNEMADHLKAGGELPPVSVVRDGPNIYWLWDGHHRVSAYETAGINSVPVEVTQDGTRKQARWLAYSANKEPRGLTRSVQDRQKAVEAALKDEPSKSDSAIAEHVGVSRKMVADWRKRLQGSAANLTSQPASQAGNGDSETVRETKDGRTINTANIGSKTTPKSTTPTPPPAEPAESDDTPQDSEPEASPEPTPQTPAKLPKNGSEVFGTAARKEAYTKLGQFIRLIHPSPFYAKAQPHCDKLMELVKGKD